MQAHATLHTLAASAIDLEDRRYFLAPEEEPPALQLIESIREFGILLPPLVLPKQDGRYTVIAGRKRLATALTLLGWEKVACLVVPEESPVLELYALLLEHSLLGSPLSLAEQSVFFANLSQVGPTRNLLPLLGKLGHKPTQHQLQELLSLQQLTRDATLALHRGTLNLATAGKLLHLSPADQKVAVTLITRFRLGSSKQQKFIDLAMELWRREGRSMADLFAPFLDRMAMLRQDNLPQQAAALLSWLHGQCFPRSSRAEQEFSRQVAQLNLPGDMKLEHAPAFEEDWLTLHLKFAGWGALRSALPDLCRVFAPTK